MNNFTLRILFGGLYVAIMMLAVVFGNPWLVILMSFLSFLGLNEIARLANKEGNQNKYFNPIIFGGIIVYLGLFGARDLGKIEFVVAFLIQLVCVVILYYSFKKRGTVNYFAAVVYIWLPLAALALWYTQYPGNNVNTLLFFLICIWFYDSMAYSVGKLIGKTPIFPKVSPKKTIEGTLGGGILTIVMMFFLNKYWLQLEANAILLAFVLVFFGTYGDFVESYLKRKLGIKDSGNLIPGHGGILDRLDSILLSAIPYLVIITLF